MTLKAHVAIHIPGAAALEGTTLRVPSAMAGVVQGLATAVERLDVVAYDPPANPVENRDRVDFAFEVPPGVAVVSLGPKGSFRDYWSRRRRIAHTVRTRSESWDVVLFRLRNRRVELVSRPNRCGRVVGYIGGFTATVIKHTDLPLWRRLVAQVASALADRDVRRIGSTAGLFLANGEELAALYRAAGIETGLLRTSSTYRRDFFLIDQRCTNDQVTIAIAGRITAAKGVIDAFDAYVAFRDTVARPTRLIVLGDGDAVDELRRRAVAAGVAAEVDFRGWVPAGTELLTQLREADIVLHLSRAESMPKMVWEAMSQSVLVVATPVGSLPVVFADGRELLFAPIGDVPATAAAMTRLVNDAALRASLLQHAHTAVEDVSVEAITEDLLGRIVARWPELAQRA